MNNKPQLNLTKKLQEHILFSVYFKKKEYKRKRECRTLTSLDHLAAVAAAAAIFFENVFLIVSFNIFKKQKF
jgi:hypothetical protein